LEIFNVRTFKRSLHAAPHPTLTSRTNIALTPHIDALLEAGCLTTAPRSTLRALGYLFPKAKADGTDRPLYDPASLNACTANYTPVTLPSLADIPPLIHPNWGFTYMFKLDAKAWYFQLPINPAIRRYFGLRDAQGRTYKWCVAPMGYRLSANAAQRITETIMSWIVRPWRETAKVAYIDDALLLATSDVDPNTLRTRVGLAERYFNVRFNWDKSVTVPSTRLLFLGLDLDLAGARWRLNPEWTAALPSLPGPDEPLPFKTWAVFLGQVAYGLHATQQPFSNFFNLLQWFRATMASQSWAQVANIRLTMWREAYHDLTRALALITANPWRAAPSSPQHTETLFTDASDYAWGAVLRSRPDKALHGPFSTQQRTSHINVKELLAIDLALQELQDLPPSTLHLVTDSAVAFWALRKGHSPIYAINRLVQRIQATLKTQRHVLRLHWIRSACNPADVPSRLVCYK
jgi:hypothetical protein